MPRRRFSFANPGPRPWRWEWPSSTSWRASGHRVMEAVADLQPLRARSRTRLTALRMRPPLMRRLRQAVQHKPQRAYQVADGHQLGISQPVAGVKNEVSKAGTDTGLEDGRV